MARRRGAKVTALRWYYVLDGVVYEAPSLQAALSARVQRLGWHLSKAFEGLREGLKAKEATSKRASRATSRATSRGSSPPPEAESAEPAADDRPRKRRRP